MEYLFQKMIGMKLKEDLERFNKQNVEKIDTLVSKIFLNSTLLHVAIFKLSKRTVSSAK